MTDQEYNDLTKYYENQFEMLGTVGWQDFLATVVAIGSKEQSIDHVKTVEELYASKGRVDILRWVMGWKDACENAYKDHLASKGETDEADV